MSLNIRDSGDVTMIAAKGCVWRRQKPVVLFIILGIAFLTSEYLVGILACFLVMITSTERSPRDYINAQIITNSNNKPNQSYHKISIDWQYCSRQSELGFAIKVQYKKKIDYTLI